MREVGMGGAVGGKGELVLILPHAKVGGALEHDPGIWRTFDPQRPGAGE